jgi:hypothetical protein
MTTLTHEPSRVARRAWWIEARDMWASLAISMIWLAVLFDAVFGPDIKSVDAGGSASVVPSSVAVALFAVVATFAVARYGFDRARKT